MADKQTGALERLNRGIEESKRRAQQQTINLAQEYFGDSAEALKQQISESRATLEDLPDQVPGGREEAFQALFQQLMDNYSTIERCIDEAQENVADLDTERLGEEPEVEASDAAVREAEELGLDLSQVRGSGEPATAEAEEQADGAGEQAQEAVGQAAGQAGEAAGQAQETVGEATDRAGQAAQGLQDAVGSPLGGDQEQENGEGQQGALGGVLDRAKQATQGVQDAAGEAVEQAQDSAGSATDRAGQAAGQAQDAAGGVAQQVQQAAPEDGDEEPRATNAARRKAQELGVDLSGIQGTGAGGLVTLKDVMVA